MADVALVGFPNVGKSHADLPHLGGQAEDRRLPVHHARAEPRRGAHATTTSRWSWPTSPASSRAPARAGAWATSSSATSSGPGSWSLLLDLAADGTGAPGRAGADAARRAGRYQPDLLEPAPAGGRLAGPTSSAADRRPVGTGPTHRRRSPARASTALVGRDGRASVRSEARADAEPETERLRRPPARRRGVPRSSATTTARFVVVGRQAERAVAAVRPHQPRGARLRPTTGSSGSASTGPWPGPVPGRRLVRIGDFAFDYAADDRDRTSQPFDAGRRSSAGLRRDVSRPMMVVAKIGTSSITDEHGEIDRVGASAKLLREVAALRADGPPGASLVTSGAIAAGPAGARPRPAARRPRDAVTLQAVVGRRPEPADAGVRRVLRPRTALVAGQVLLAPLDFMRAVASTCTPGARSCGCSSSASCRSSTRTTPSPTTRSASATTTASPRSSPTWSAPTSSSCSPTRRALLTADPRLDAAASLIEEIVEVDHELEALAGGAGHGRGGAGAWRRSWRRPRSRRGPACGR